MFLPLFSLLTPVCIICVSMQTLPAHVILTVSVAIFNTSEATDTAT